MRTTPNSLLPATRLRSLTLGLAAAVAVTGMGGSAAGQAIDSDGDGISDSVERRTGTDPLRRDTDADGVADGQEDRDRDGRYERQDAETDPRRPGLFPGEYPHIPEPLVFDLVRGLGARRGELEANTLVLVNPRNGRVTWAPEVEWAFADNYAVELELPMVDRHLEALKLALQGTLPGGAAVSLTHGLQAFAEVALSNGHTDAVLLYLLGQRLGRAWTYLAMAGAKTTVSGQGVSSWQGLFNVSVFVDLREWLTFGLESNSAVDGYGHLQVRAFPQVHIQLNQHVRLQLLLGGIELDRHGSEPLLGARVIME